MCVHIRIYIYVCMYIHTYMHVCMYVLRQKKSYEPTRCFSNLGQPWSKALIRAAFADWHGSLQKKQGGLNTDQR